MFSKIDSHECGIQVSSKYTTVSSLKLMVSGNSYLKSDDELLSLLLNLESI